MISFVYETTGCLTSNNIYSERVNYVICSDIFGPFDKKYFKFKTKTQKEFFITITGVYSQYKLVIFTTRITEDNIIGSLDVLINKFGELKKIICDNGVQYSAKKFDEYLNSMKIKKASTPIYHPYSNVIDKWATKSNGCRDAKNE